MAKKKISFLLIMTSCLLAVGLISTSVESSVLKAMRGANPSSYDLVLSGSNAPSSLTSSYQNEVKGAVVTELGNIVNLTFSGAKLNGGNIQIANHGKIHNFDTGNSAVTAVNGVTLVGSGSLSFKPAILDSGKGALLAEVDPVTVSAGAGKVTVPACDYFELEAGDSGATITSLTLSFSCDPSAYDNKLINGTYTVLGVDTYTYKLVFSNGTATLTSLDKPSNTSTSGTVALSDRTSGTVTLGKSSYSLSSYDGYSFALYSGAYTNFNGKTFNKVHKVENFQSYSATGTGYISADAKWTTTGLRSQIYADYYTGSSSGEIGGSGWPIMTSTDNTTLLSTKGHDGTKGGAFKFSNGMGMRYISMNELYGVESIIGKGAKLSLWARGAYTNTNFNTNHASDTPMKAYAFYATPLTPSTQSTVRETFDFTVSSGSTWQHFEFDLTAGRRYYGFGFYAKQSSGSTQYVPIDDVEIYTDSPYKEYVAPVAVTGVSLNTNALNLVTGGSDSLIATVAPNDATNKNVTWSTSNSSVATVADGVVTAVSAGNASITVTTVDGGYTASCTVTVSAPVAYYPSGTFYAPVTIGSASYKLVIAIGTQANQLVGVKISTYDASPTGITYNSGNNTFTITTTGSVGGYTVGNITGTYDYANDRLTNVNCSGQIGAAVSNLTLNRPSDSSTMKFNNCDASTSVLQSTFKRRYMSGSWQVDSSNADRITSNTTEFAAGSGSLKRRGYSGGAVALNFNSDFSSAITVANIQFWVYNPSNSDISLRMWGYKAKSFVSNFETGSVTAKANSWTYVGMGFTSSAIYNWQIADFNNTGVYLSFDDIFLF